MACAGLTLKIKPITLEQELEIQERYVEAYREAQEEGFLTKKELLDSLKERGLWTEEDEKKEEGLEKDIDRLKVELFQNKNKSDMVAQIRKYLKAGKEQLNKVLEKKFQHYEISCEGMASIEKVKKLVSISCFKQIKPARLITDISYFWGKYAITHASIRSKTVFAQ